MANPNIGAFIIRIGFWGPLYYIIIRSPQKSVGNYLDLYTKSVAEGDQMRLTDLGLRMSQIDNLRARVESVQPAI